MERNYFSWNGWDQQDLMCFIFYQPILKVDIGHLKTGDKFDMACIDYDKGILEFYKDDENDEQQVVATFKFTLNFLSQEVKND